MAETLISPGVLARENDQSQITSQPVQAGAAIVGPTVKGQPNIPKLVTSYSEYLANFGSTFTSGSDTYSYFTSISAFNYFQNGGSSLLVTRVVSESFSPAVSTEVYNAIESGKINIVNLTGSLGPASTTNADGAIGQVFDAAPQDLVAGSNTVTPTYTATAAGESPTIPTFTVVTTGTGSLNSIVPTDSGSDFAVGGVLTFAGTALGGGGSLLIGATAFTSGVGTAVGDGTAVGTIDNIPLTSTPGTGAVATATVALTGKYNGTNNNLTVNAGTIVGGNNLADSAALNLDAFTTGGGTGATYIISTGATGIPTKATVSGVGTSGYNTATTITLTAAQLNALGDATIGTAFSGLGNWVVTVTNANLESSVTTFVIKDTNGVGGGGTGYTDASLLTFDATTMTAGGITGACTYQVVAGDLVADDLQAGTNIVWTLAAGDIDNEDTFVLETLSEGNMMNSYG